MSEIDNSFKGEGVPMRRFFLRRLKDETGISRTGRVLEGVLCQDGKVITQWRPPHSTIGVYNSLEEFMTIHVDCHPSCNEVVWLDKPEGFKPAAVCIDCDWHHQHPEPLPGVTCRPNGSPGHEGEIEMGFFCVHWRPEHWEAQGFKRHWGDAAVSMWPKMEILRREKDGLVEYVILAPFTLRRPLVIHASRVDEQIGFLPWSWGSY